MKVTEDGNGKHIIDFEGLEVRVGSNCAVNKLFNCDTVSEIKHGHFIFSHKCHFIFPHRTDHTYIAEGLPIVTHSSFIGENKE